MAPMKSGQKFCGEQQGQVVKKATGLFVDLISAASSAVAEG